MLLGFAGQGFVYCGDVRELLPASALPHSSVAALCQSLCAPLWGLQAGFGASTPEQGLSACFS